MQSYDDLQRAITNCQFLYFLEEEGEVYAVTDASEYGFGAYLCQIIKGIERPIAFISKSFKDEQTRWKTIEQECFAIFFALTEWEYLLQGRKFTVRTDHNNLRYMLESSSDKVVRWKLAIQRFDATFEHMRGKFNKVADPFSRLVENVKEKTERVKLGMVRVSHLFMCTQTDNRQKERVGMGAVGLAAMTKSKFEIPAHSNIFLVDYIIGPRVNYNKFD